MGASRNSFAHYGSLVRLVSVQLLGSGGRGPSYDREAKQFDDCRELRNQSMRSGTCPKCGSETILRSRKHGGPGMHMIHISVTEAGFVECLICADCGFVEAYVPAQLDRGKMLNSFERYVAEV
ncbi:MAG: ssDNA-binding Zn-finger/Zn-ribbon topoisomerase 1 [Planctomycetota bacterium]|jgi:ssDNA-binding Zn-finger/Zn-ribbon topoisomerase 1